MRVIWSRDAQDDVFDIVIFYGLDDPALADEFVDRIEAAPVRLIDFPRLGRRLGGRATRKWSVPRTPFILLYVADDDRIEIERVVHVSSDWEAS